MRRRGADFIREIEESRRDLAAACDAFLARHRDDLQRICAATADALAAGGKLLVFGNGGSATQAQHLAAELVHRYRDEREALAAVALTADGAVLTSIANDTAFERVFARQIEALGRPGDVALALSTSGRSPNVLAGLDAARRGGLATIALLGRDGGGARGRADEVLLVPGERTDRIQEVQLWAGHLFCRGVELALRSGAGETADAADRSGLRIIPARSG